MSNREIQTRTIPVEIMRLRATSYALKHPETWPPTFRWGYRSIAGCGIGLAYELGLLERADVEAVAKDFGMSWPAVGRIFLYQPPDVSPADIAQGIDWYLGMDA